MPTLTQICNGEAGCCLNVLLSPFVLIWRAFEIYVFSCFSIICARSYRLWCGVCINLCSTWRYTDKEFEGDKAIGGKPRSIDWVRANEILPKDSKQKKPYLYHDGIDPADLCQGAVGDCWLIAALASAAEHPACIRNAFKTCEYNPRGRYDVRLFDPDAKVWETVTVDDRIPCKKGTTRTEFLKCDGKELWAVLLEKAFAKFCGSYDALDGGWAVWGWAVLTGDHVFRLKFEENENKWSKMEVKCKRGKAGEGTDMLLYGTDESYTKDEMWNLILNYTDDKSLIAASGGKEMGKNIAVGGNNAAGLNGEQTNDAAGLVGTHAYSILDARELGLIPGLKLGGGLLGQTRLIRLRNPWGSYEWKGAWSDGSKEWKENPLVKMRLRPKDEDDGTFWMPWDQFVAAGFNKIDICDRTTKNDLRLSAEEDWGVLGIICGCMSGLVNFFCFCQGCLTIYFGAQSSDKTKSTKRGCAKCAEDAKDVVQPVPVEINRA